MLACRQAGTRAGRDAGGRARMPARRQEGVPAIPTAKERAFAKLMSLCRRVAAFGADVVACGVFQPLSAPDLPLTFAPKRQGKAESAYRRPRLRPSFGQPEGIGRPIPLWDGNNSSTLNRRTKQEQSQARLNYEDTARCPLSYSKGFGLLPKRPCPLRGGASSPKSGSLFSYLRCGCRKLRLGRDTTKSIVI